MTHALMTDHLEALLRRLATDRDEAGARYVALRRRLVAVFEHRGCAEPDALADDTLDRVATRLAMEPEPACVDPCAYAFGVAWNVARESFHRTRPVPLPEDWDPPESAAEDADDERSFRCLDQCLAQVPERVRELVLEYYQDERSARIEHRALLAWRLGVSRSALRVRVHRITIGLRECVAHCVDHASSAA
jgi:DNA-directed RNA polymerase specialized sigma24 family protein